MKKDKSALFGNAGWSPRYKEPDDGIGYGEPAPDQVKDDRNNSVGDTQTDLQEIPMKTTKEIERERREQAMERAIKGGWMPPN